MKLLSSMIDDMYNNGNQDESKLYPVNRIYISRLVSFINHLPHSIDRRNHVQEIYEPYLVLLKHETGNIYIDIETGERFTSDTESAVFYDKDYRFGKLYVSTKYREAFKGRCYYTLKDKGLLDTNYLSLKQLRDVLDAELTWEDVKHL